MEALQNRGRKAWMLPVIFCMLAVMLVLGSAGIRAYLQDRESAYNVFTVGDVDIALSEPNWPGGARVVANQVVPKDPVITNTGTNDAVVFVKVSVPVKTVSIMGEDGKLVSTGNVTELFQFRHYDEDGILQPGPNTEGVKRDENAADGTWVELWSREVTGQEDDDFTEYVFAYSDRLASGAYTVPVFDAVKYKAILEGYSEISKINPDTTYRIYIDAYAIQAEDILDRNDTDITDVLDAGGQLSEENLVYIWDAYFNQNDPDHHSMMDYAPNDDRFNGMTEIEEPAHPRKEGYEVSGWTYTDENGQEQTADFPMPVTDWIRENGITFTPVWEPIHYTIRFDANGGTGSMDDLAMVYDEEKALPLNTFTRRDYAFLGWSESRAGVVNYTDQGTVKNLLAEPGTASLYALWKKAGYTITFDANGGYFGNDTSSFTNFMSYSLDGSVSSGTYAEPKHLTEEFAGWYLDPECTQEAADLTAFSDSVTCYAGWKAKAVQVKYAVSIYGILQDTDEEGNAVGLTFGPATGESYVNTYKSHIPSAGQMCMHDMTWEEIIAQSKNDPSVFQECLENGCTHAVELTITGKLAEGATSYPDMTGDGTGILYNSIASSYRKWNRENSAYFDSNSDEYKDGTNQGGWPDSAIRNTLNGVVTDNMFAITNNDNGFEEAKLDESTALISCFPSELKAAIVPKAVRSDTVYNDVSSNNAITYDKLWLFSGREIFGDSNSVGIIRANEGSVYERTMAQGITTSNFDKNQGYNEESIGKYRWLRSLYRTNKFFAYYVTGTGGTNYQNSHVKQMYALAPGFCLPGPKPDVKYAVSLYGIAHDTYSEDDGATEYTAGLTFGPATGASYVDSYVEHEPTGVTVYGDEHRCIHKDSWAEIIFWSQEDPYVYEQCYGDLDTPSCTKSVPLYLNSKLKGTTYSEMTGDGAGVLYDSINSNYRNWNNQHSEYFTDSTSYDYKYGTNQGGWPNSKIRNTLNGVVTNDMLDIANKNNGFEESQLNKENALISCFPAELKSSIVPKAVKSGVVCTDMNGNIVTTYDKLWLFSTKESYVSAQTNVIHSNEGTPYERISIHNFVNGDSELNRGFPESKIKIAYGRWLRTCAYNMEHLAMTVASTGSTLGGMVYDGNNAIGLAPGFCLK